MPETEVSKWQFIDKYYDEILIPLYKTIIEAYMEEEYDIAFKAMEQLIFHIWKEIKKNVDKGTDKLTAIKNRIEAIYEVKNNLKLLEYEIEAPEEDRIERMTKLKSDLKKEVDNLYLDTTGIISDLNMFMPKIKQDNRKDIYKQ